MLAQLYKEGEELRIFDEEDNFVCDLKSDFDTHKADLQLNRLRIKRQGKWHLTDWGYEARVKL